MPRQGMQQRVATAILDAAARVLATHGGRASMNDVAAEAGVARATLYRYFPNRQALLDELADVAVADAGARLVAARIDELPVEEAVPRAVRAMVDVGASFVVLVRTQARGDQERFEASIVSPLSALFARAQSAGHLRDDVPSEWLTGFLVDVVMGVLESARELGRDDTIALVTSLFFDGARRRRPKLEAVE
jgi:TetR/AcrR family transcriptional repressor of mexCD-oprJ operon